MKDTPFMSADEKQRVLFDWCKFMNSGLVWPRFTERLYKHLIRHCSFIAHVNRRGFYETYFGDVFMTERFLRQFDRNYGCSSVEYGGSDWLKRLDYGDINRAMVNAAEGELPKLRAACQSAEKEKLLEERKRIDDRLQELEVGTR